MSHLKDIKSNSNNPDNRNLGDEWLDWDGKGEGDLKAGKGLFVWFSLAVIIVSDLLLAFIVYMISPRLAMFFNPLPVIAWSLIILYMLVTALWFLELFSTTYYGKTVLFFKSRPHFYFEWLLGKVVWFAKICGISRDKIGNSFVHVSNAVSKSTKKKGKDERLLILLPRCLSKEEIKKITDMKNIYPIEVFTVSGGELARKKVKEIRPTAVIGVACERDLVSAIQDVGGKFSVIGIPNIRPEGPCKNTHVDMDELERSIQFYVGEPKESNS